MMRRVQRFILPYLVLLLFPIGSRAQITLSGSGNSFAQVIGIDSCENSLIVNSVAGFVEGGEILLIQMQGAQIDQSNTGSFGTITDYASVGNYEFAEIKKISGLKITLTNKLLRTYDPFAGFQIVSVMQTAGDAVVSSTLSPKAWDGITGGIVAIDVGGTLELQADINASGTGFRGGALSANNGSVNSLQGFFYAGTTGEGGYKGEGIAKYVPTKECGRGAQSNGGGGGNALNSGGGGGGHISDGGIGGNQSDPNARLTIGGFGGRLVTYAFARLFFGGGGGAGQQNDGAASPGASGGGIILIKAGTLKFSGGALISNGANALTGGNDGAGGGGGGGVVAIEIQNVLGTQSISAHGGNGGDNNALNFPNYCYAPGGGGSGGAFLVSGVSGATFTPDLSGGKAGKVILASLPCYNTTFGATDGGQGGAIYNQTIPKGVQPFIKPSAPVRIVTICEGDSATITATGGVSYLWSPSGGLNRVDIDQPIAKPNASTQYLVAITTGNNCTYIDTVQVIVNKAPKPTIIGATTVCANTSSPYYYSPDPSVTATWTVSGSAGSSKSGDTLIVNWGSGATGTVDLVLTDNITGCKGSATLNVTISSFVKPKIAGLKAICEGEILMLTADTGYASYKWSNGDITPSTQISKPGKYFVEVTIAAGCTGSSDTLNVIVNPLPTPTITTSTFLLPNVGGSSTLDCIGSYVGYLWTTGEITPSITVTDSGKYTVTVIDANGCSAMAEVHILRDYGPPMITIALDTLQAAPGDHVTYPFRIIYSQNMPQSGATDFTADLTFDATLLAPVTPTLASNIIAGMRTITVGGKKDVNQTQGTIPGIEFIAALGDATETSITVSNFQWTNSNKSVGVTNNEGRLIINKICKQGGTRLFSADGKLLLAQSHPNPASNITTIDYHTIEDGMTKLYLTDMLGRMVKMVVDGEFASGIYAATLDVSGLAPGMYCYVLHTPSQLLRRTLLIQH